MTNLRNLMMVAAAAGLAGCGDSGDGGGAGGGDRDLTFDQIASEGNALISRLEDDDLTTVGDMPTTGSATYNGFAAYGTTPDADDITSDPISVSQIELNADFGAGEISGRAYDFESATAGVDIDGELDISNGLIEDNAFDADLGGTLVEDGVTVTYDGGIGGVFVGEDAGGIVGSGSAVATAGGQSGTVYGVFGGER